MPRRNRYPCSFAFRLEETVARRLREVAEAHGYQPAEWARKIVSTAIAADFERRAVRLRVQNADLLRRYLEEMVRQGNNLNQIARRLNSGARDPQTTVLRELEAIHRQTEIVTIAVLDALGANRKS